MVGGVEIGVDTFTVGLGCANNLGEMRVAGGEGLVGSLFGVVSKADPTAAMNGIAKEG